MKDYDNIKEAIEKNPFTIVEFGTTQCSACGAIDQKLEKWAADYDMVEYFYLPIEEYMPLAAEYQIFSAPTVLCFTEGHLIKQSSGYFSVEEIFQMMERYISMWQE